MYRASYAGANATTIGSVSHRSPAVYTCTNDAGHLARRLSTLSAAAMAHPCIHNRSSASCPDGRHALSLQPFLQLVAKVAVWSRLTLLCALSLRWLVPALMRALVQSVS